MNESTSEWFPGWSTLRGYNAKPSGDDFSNQDCIEIRQNFGGDFGRDFGEISAEISAAISADLGMAWGLGPQPGVWGLDLKSGPGNWAWGLGPWV